MGAGPEGEPPEHGCESQLCRVFDGPPGGVFDLENEGKTRNYGEDPEKSSVK